MGKISKILRATFNFMPEHFSLSILQGRLRGKKWVVNSGALSYWIGNFEQPQQKVFEKTITLGSTVFDIGANVGFYTLLAAHLTGPDGRVFSFEPLPENIFFLNKHLRLNHCANVTVLDVAVSDRSGLGWLKDGKRNNTQWYLAKDGTLRVRVVCLDDLVYQEKILPLPDFIKIDVEGEEVQVLLGAKQILREKRPTMFLSMHSLTIRQDCLRFLRSLDYNLEPIEQPTLESCAEVLAKPKQ